MYQETEKRAKDIQGLKGSGSGNKSNQAQNQASGSARAGGEDANNSQKESSAMVRQMSSQSCSSSELNQLASETENKDNANIPGGLASSRRCGVCCFHFSSMLPGRHASKRSVNTTTTTVDEAEQSSCDSFNNNEVDACGDKSGSEEEADGASPSRPPTGWP